MHDGSGAILTHDGKPRTVLPDIMLIYGGTGTSYGIGRVMFQGVTGALRVLSR